MIPGMVAAAFGQSAAPTLWDYDDLSIGITQWVDFSDSATITLVGSNISQILDKSSNGLVYNQGTDSRRPAIVSADLNGLDVANFSGGSDFLRSTSALAVSSDGQFSAFAVVRPSAAGAVQTYIAQAETSPTPRVFLFGFDNVDQHRSTIYAADNTGTTTDCAVGTILNTWTVAEVQRNATVAKVALSTVYDTNSAAKAAHVAARNFNIGATSTTPTATLNGKIGEILIVPGIPSADELARIQGRMHWKWGLQANLPIGHTYKAAPPTL